MGGLLTVFAVLVNIMLIPHGDPAPVRGLVTRVVDGDTVHVSVAGHDVDVRLLGVDTPETKKPGTPIQCGGPQATVFAHQHLDGQQVTLTGDPTQQDTDRYHRLLRYIQLPDGSDYSVDVAAAGWARSYVYARKPVQEHAKIEAAQTQAQNAHLGMWAICPAS